MVNILSMIKKEISSDMVIIEPFFVEKVFLASNSPNIYEKEASPDACKPFHIPTFSLGYLTNQAHIIKTLGLDIKNVLLSRESIFASKSLRPGESVTVKTYLKNAYEKQATLNPIGFIILDILGFEKNQLIFSCERVLAVRGGLSLRARL